VFLRGHPAEVTGHALVHISQILTAWGLIRWVTDLLLLLWREPIEVEALMLSEVELSQLSGLLDQVLIRWEAKRIECRVYRPCQITRVNGVNKGHILLIDRVECESLSTTIVCETGVGPSRDGPGQVTLTLATSHKDGSLLAEFVAVKEISHETIDFGDIDTFHFLRIIND
jgi:hypothetical protein